MKSAWFGSLALIALPLCLFALRAEPSPATARGERGRALYERHCAVCHGAQGRGDGAAAYLLHPAARDFTSGRFRLVSTTNGVPTQGDLIASIRRGMPGSAMPPWEWLAEEDLWDLALYVRQLSIEGQVADLRTWAEQEEEELSEAQARAIVEAKMLPGELVQVGAPAPSDPVTLHEGRRLYMTICATCHGEDGTGSSPLSSSGELVNEDGTPNNARDFTAGIFKGGATHADIVRRVVAGLPGSPMPGTRFEDPAQVGILSAYVRSLVKPGAEERVVQLRRTVPVARAPGQVPLDPADPAWSRAEPVWIALMPLWWRDQRVEGVVVRALHDGETIAFHLAYRDPTNDDDLIGAQAFSDAAAVEISGERDPPLVAMGAAEHPVDIAYWRAAWERDALAARDVRDRWPDMVDDTFPDVVGDLRDESITARAVGNSQSFPKRPNSAESLTAQGLGTIGPHAGAPSWSARSTWTAGYRDVVFSRSMRVELEDEHRLSPGVSAFIAFAVWDGAFRDRNGQKSASVWHRLQVAP